MKRTMFVFAAFVSLIIGGTGCTDNDLSGGSAGGGINTANLTSFSYVGPTTGGQILNNPKTRTLGIFDGDTTLNVWWTKDDHVYINHSGSIVRDSVNSINDSLSTAKTDSLSLARFWFAGNFTTADDSLPVRYTGTNPSTGSQVTIASIQNQQKPNYAIDLGKMGDCGTGIATHLVHPGDTIGGYKFTLQRRAAYATFMPYYKSEQLRGSVRIKSIQVSADQPVAGTFGFSDTGLDISSVQNGSKTITLIPGDTLTNFGKVPTAADPAINGAIMVLAPGTYTNFTVTYNLVDTMTEVTAAVSKNYGTMVFAEGKNKRFHKNLADSMRSYTPRFSSYYMWDAQQNYWYGYTPNNKFVKEYLGAGAVGGGGYYIGTDDDFTLPSTRSVGSRSLLDIPDPGGGTETSTSLFTDNVIQNPLGTSATPNSNDKGPRFFNDGTTPANSANNSNIVNYEQLTWYLGAGDPHFDNTKIFVYLGHLCRNGIWFKKSKYIVGFSSTTPYGGYPATATSVNQKIFPAFSTPADTSQYFFLPLLGTYTGNERAVTQPGWLRSLNEVPTTHGALPPSVYFTRTATTSSNAVSLLSGFDTNTTNNVYSPYIYIVGWAKVNGSQYFYVDDNQ